MNLSFVHEIQLVIRRGVEPLFSLIQQTWPPMVYTNSGANMAENLSAMYLHGGDERW
jgi:hypothetical protein